MLKVWALADIISKVVHTGSHALACVHATTQGLPTVFTQVKWDGDAPPAASGSSEASSREQHALSPGAHPHASGGEGIEDLKQLPTLYERVLGGTLLARDLELHKLGSAQEPMQQPVALLPHSLISAAESAASGGALSPRANRLPRRTASIRFGANVSAHKWANNSDDEEDEEQLLAQQGGNTGVSATQPGQLAPTPPQPVANPSLAPRPSLSTGSSAMAGTTRPTSFVGTNSGTVGGTRHKSMDQGSPGVGGVLGPRVQRELSTLQINALSAALGGDSRSAEPSPTMDHTAEATQPKPPSSALHHRARSFGKVLPSPGSTASLSPKTSLSPGALSPTSCGSVMMASRAWGDRSSPPHLDNHHGASASNAGLHITRSRTVGAVLGQDYWHAK